MVCKNPIHPQPTPYRRDGIGEGRLDLARPFHPARGPRATGNRSYNTATTENNPNRQGASRNTVASFHPRVVSSPK